MDQTHFVYTADSTKIGKTIAMLLAGRLLGPDWSRYAVHHYAVKSNAFEGVSRIQLQSKFATALQGKQVYLQIHEPSGALVPGDRPVTITAFLNDAFDTQVWSQRISWHEIDHDVLTECWVWLRLLGQDGRLADPSDYLIHPDNRC